MHDTGPDAFDPPGIIKLRIGRVNLAIRLYMGHRRIAREGGRRRLRERGREAGDQVIAIFDDAALAAHQGLLARAGNIPEPDQNRHALVADGNRLAIRVHRRSLGRR